ncbi:GTPase-activating protein gyp8 [Conoideocrella luteorostrata]|uniref:GTPase-activating protein gyp8 n=1 Tax=Conoideocrella luteorostrata TaxID=1105319 RepID=A0AAJ0CUP0_9HYPO|nr:GTPase-activating protein gyp8 [Conoideocrella luteorostrata]
MEPDDIPIEVTARLDRHDRKNLGIIHDASKHQAAHITPEKKTSAILDACKWRDITKLRSLAESGAGLLNDDLRGLAWPILLGLSPLPSDGNADTSRKDDWRALARHRDEEQVQLDVNRSFVYYPNDKSEAQLDKCKSELSSLIVEVLRRYPYLCYFQGYHDICQVFLLVLRPEWRARAVARLSVLRIRDFMLPNLGPTTAQLRLLPNILAKADPKLRKHIATIEPFYALAGTLTMYAHNIQAYRDIARLFDVFLAREPVFTIYLFAQIVINRRDEILDIDEPDMLQVVLAKVPPSMDLDALIAHTIELFHRHPPESLPSWRRISRSSSLKTARDIEACAEQTMEDGQAFFKGQTKEVRWMEMRDRISMAFWRYRRPIKAVGMAALVATVAFYLRRNPSAVQYLVSFFGTLSRP